MENLHTAILNEAYTTTNEYECRLTIIELYLKELDLWIVSEPKWYQFKAHRRWKGSRPLFRTMEER